METQGLCCVGFFKKFFKCENVGSFSLLTSVVKWSQKGWLRLHNTAPNLTCFDVKESPISFTEVTGTASLKVRKLIVIVY